MHERVGLELLRTVYAADRREEMPTPATPAPDTRAIVGEADLHEPAADVRLGRLVERRIPHDLDHDVPNAEPGYRPRITPQP
ncbi:hypothetical protein ACFC4S_35180, partial [Priestia megaterium]|uniref:hypothetical protein n=1 Tax=Priestia megaterium TaxID=1404 RepID=UPI0035D54BB5